MDKINLQAFENICALKRESCSKQVHAEISNIRNELKELDKRYTLLINQLTEIHKVTKETQEEVLKSLVNETHKTIKELKEQIEKLSDELANIDQNVHDNELTGIGRYKDISKLIMELDSKIKELNVVINTMSPELYLIPIKKDINLLNKIILIVFILSSINFIAQGDWGKTISYLIEIVNAIH